MWYRLSFNEARVTVTFEYQEASHRISDGMLEAYYPPDIGVFYSDDWVIAQAGDEVALVIYFSPRAAEMFVELILEFGGVACGKPLPFGLMQFGNKAAWKLLA